MTEADWQAEVAAVLALVLPDEMPVGAAPRLAADLRVVVAALPPSGHSPGDRAMRRDLLAAADLLDHLDDTDRLGGQ